MSALVPRAYDAPRVGGAVQPTATGYVALAIAELGVDASASAQLSPQSAALAAAYELVLSSGIGEAIGKAAVEVVSQVSDAVGESVANVVGDVAEVVPIIGQVISFAIAGYNYVQGALDAEEQHQADECRAELARLKPIPSGSGLVPGDLFAGYHDVQHYVDGGEARLIGRSPRIGHALRVITEDRFILDKGDNAHLNDKIIWRARKELGDSKVGVKVARRRQFARLRVAIEAAWRPPYTSPLRDAPRIDIHVAPALYGVRKVGGTWFVNPVPRSPYPEPGVGDGGASLWPIYLDLLAAEFEAGRITRAYVKWKLDEDLFALNGTKDACGAHDALAEGVVQLIDRWEEKVRHPNYSTDKIAQDAYAATIASVQSRMGIVPSAALARRFRVALERREGHGVELVVGGLVALAALGRIAGVW